MRVIIESDYQALSQWAANYVASKINAANPTPEKPFVLGCPTGSSPLGMYKALIELNKQGKVSFQNVVTFNMDEYVGLPEDHPESYHTFMWKNFFNHIDIKKENVHILNGNATDLEAECANYEKQIAEIGGIDLFMAGNGDGGRCSCFNDALRTVAAQELSKSLPMGLTCFESFDLSLYSDTVTPGMNTKRYGRVAHLDDPVVDPLPDGRLQRHDAEGQELRQQEDAGDHHDVRSHVQTAQKLQRKGRLQLYQPVQHNHHHLCGSKHADGFLRSADAVGDNHRDVL